MLTLINNIVNQEYAVQAYTTTKSDKVSAKYTQVNSLEVYNVIESLGYVKESSKAIKGKTNNPHSRHITSFINPNIDIGDCRPRILVDNSHDGSRSLYIRFGVLRLVCANGLVLGSDLVTPIRIPHIGKIEKIEEKIYTFVAESIAAFNAAYTKFSSITLSTAQRLEFYDNAMALRYEMDAYSTDWKERRKLDMIRRVEDSGESLWVIYNKVQEALVNSGVRRRSRAISSATRAVDFNNDLFNLAMKYAA
jgi:hypothetical protein